MDYNYMFIPSLLAMVVICLAFFSMDDTTVPRQKHSFRTSHVKHAFSQSRKTLKDIPCKICILQSWKIVKEVPCRISECNEDKCPLDDSKIGPSRARRYIRDLVAPRTVNRLTDNGIISHFSSPANKILHAHHLLRFIDSEQVVPVLGHQSRSPPS